MPNFLKIGQTVAEIWRFNGFQNGGRRHLGFKKIRNFVGLSAKLDWNPAVCSIIWKF